MHGRTGERCGGWPARSTRFTIVMRCAQGGSLRDPQGAAARKRAGKIPEINMTVRDLSSVLALVLGMLLVLAA